MLLGDPSHNRNMVAHERCYLGRLRIDLYQLHQPTARNAQGRIAKLLISRKEGAPHLPHATVWRVIDHVEEAWETERELAAAVDRLRRDVVRRATRASL